MNELAIRVGQRVPFFGYMAFKMPNFGVLSVNDIKGTSKGVDGLLAHHHCWKTIKIVADGGSDTLRYLVQDPGVVLDMAAYQNGCSV